MSLDLTGGLLATSPIVVGALVGAAIVASLVYLLVTDLKKRGR